MHSIVKPTAAHFITAIAPVALLLNVAHAQTTLLGRQLVSLIDTFNGVILLLLLIAIAVFSWGIVALISAAGSPEQVRKAKGILWWGIVGIAVLASIAGLINVLQMAFGVSGTGTINPPQFFRR